MGRNPGAMIQIQTITDGGQQHVGARGFNEAYRAPPEIPSAEPCSTVDAQISLNSDFIVKNQVDPIDFPHSKPARNRTRIDGSNDKPQTHFLLASSTSRQGPEVYKHAFGNFRHAFFNLPAKYRGWVGLRGIPPKRAFPHPLPSPP